MGQALSARERERYRRQWGLPRWGEEAQERLKASTVFVAGAGGLGSAAILYLAAAGVGRLRICDDDALELSNLNRQVLHAGRRLGRGKADSAVRAVRRLNPDVRAVPLAVRIDERNAAELIGNASLLLDCLDNLPSRLALNAHAVRARTPLVHAGVSGLRGQVTFLHPPETPCLACFLDGGAGDLQDPEPPPILGAVAGTVGCLQALEALKHLAGIGGCLKGRLCLFDGATMGFDEIGISNDPRCPVCGSGE